MTDEEKRIIAMKIVNPLRKPQTNADRIRQMSDEELALILSVRHYCPLKRMNKCSFYFSKDDGCSQCWLDWLKAPVEEVQDGT